MLHDLLPNEYKFLAEYVIIVTGIHTQTLLRNLIENVEYIFK